MLCFNILDLCSIGFLGIALCNVLMWLLLDYNILCGWFLMGHGNHMDEG